MAVPLAVICRRHPTRPGFALCMTCRESLCQECATTFDGVNYCQECLCQQRGAQTRTAGWGRVAGYAAEASGLIGLAWLLAWAMAKMAVLVAAWR